MGARAAWSAALGQALVARVAAGESVRAICREAGAPDVRTVGKWVAAKPEFAAAMKAARLAAGSPLTGRASTYCDETAEAIFARLAEGEGLVAICRDPLMPAVSTVMKWRHERPAFGQALDMARDIAAETLFEAGRQICEGVTPQTARACEVRLRHLRWQAAKLAPRKYGSFRAVEAAEAAALSGGGGMTVMIKRFVLAPPGDTGAGAAGAGGEGAGGRWADEPGEVLYSLTERQMAGEFDGQPHPGAVAWAARQARWAAARPGDREGAENAGAAKRAPDDEAW